jgi:hypothetical protein
MHYPAESNDDTLRLSHQTECTIEFRHRRSTRFLMWPLSTECSEDLVESVETRAV